MTKLLSPSAKQQFFTDGSTVAAGYLLHTYLANTTTNEATYSNRAGTVANANPIVLDARGEATIYLTPGVVYDYVLKTPGGATVWTREDVDAQAGEADAVSFTQAGVGAVTRTVQERMRDTVHAKDFGVAADGVTNDSVSLQNAIDYCAANEHELTLPPGDILLSAGLTHSTGSLHLRGAICGTQGTRLLIKADAPAITLTAQATIENLGIIGEQSGAKTLQAGIYINNTNNIDVRNVVFEGCYDSIKLLDTCFYINFHNIRWFSCVRAHVYGSGVTAPGYAVQFAQCMMTPAQGQYGFYLENVGSLILSDVMMSPANLTERCFMWKSNASLSGDSRFNNVVFEGSVKEAVRIEGTALAPIKYVYFNNCYFNQSGAGQDAITLGYVRNVSFVNSYISGTGAGVTIYGDTKYVRLVNADLPGGGAVGMLRALGGATIDTLDIENVSYTGANRLLDISAITGAAVRRISVRGGFLGTHATPLLVNAADAAQVSCSAIGNTQTRNGGITQFNGGVSLFLIPHGLIGTPSKFSVTSNSLDAGNAEIREVTVTSTTLDVQCKGAAVGGVNNVKWAWTAEV